MSEATELVYLGDSVYVRLIDGMVELTTRNGLPTDPSNTIYLEIETLDALLRYLANVKKPAQ